ncbi:MAG: hypothetical protein KDB82_12110 [Planctomycetes bacterium]|nr:hypothetical protein [Planctomycetota bacterium]
MKALPSVEALWKNNKDRGLHVFLVECQGHGEEELRKYAASKGLTFPIPIRNKCDFGGYQGGSGLPYAWVIGPDGKVVWQGRKGYDAVCVQQLERIKYPGLGKLEVAPECEKAATEFAGGKYAAAREEAVKVKEKDADNEAAVADAQFIIDRVDAKVAELRAKIDDAKAKRRYLDAVNLLEELSGKAFKGMEVADKAKDEAKELKKEQKDEIKAWEQLEKTIAVNEKIDDAEKKKKNLEKFCDKYEGTAAAEEAKKMAEGASD